MELLRVLRAALQMPFLLAVVPWWAEAALRRRRRLLHAAVEALRRGRFSRISHQNPSVHYERIGAPFERITLFTGGATSHVTPSRAAAREVATGRPPPTRTTPLRPLALSFPSPLKSSYTPGVFGPTVYLRDLRDLLGVLF